MQQCLAVAVTWLRLRCSSAWLSQWLGYDAAVLGCRSGLAVVNMQQCLAGDVAWLWLRCSSAWLSLWLGCAVMRPSHTPHPLDSTVGQIDSQRSRPWVRIRAGCARSQRVLPHPLLSPSIEVVVLTCGFV
eukprot:362961-Chlamydomonas_euryale.AAC.9